MKLVFYIMHGFFIYICGVMEKWVKSLNVNFSGKETTSDVYAVISLNYCA
jgi:hypothetical protein